MAKGMLKNQSHKQKACRCGRGTIYTDSNAKYNQKIDGVEVCEHCATDHIVQELLNKFHNKEN